MKIPFIKNESFGYLTCTPDEMMPEKCSTNGMVVHTIDQFLKKATENKVRFRVEGNRTFFCSNGHTAHLHHEDLTPLLVECAIDSGVPYFTAKYYRFISNLEKQFRSVVKTYPHRCFLIDNDVLNNRREVSE